MFDNPFEPPPDDVVTDPPRPAVGDVWCRRQYAGLGNTSIGRVDVTDTLVLQGNPMVKFVPRSGDQLGKTVMLPVRVFLDMYVPKALSDNPR